MKTTIFIAVVIVGALVYRQFLNTLPMVIALPVAVASMVRWFRGFISSK